MKIDAELRVKYHPLVTLVYDEEDNFSTVTVSCYSSSGPGIAQYCDDQQNIESDVTDDSFAELEGNTGDNKDYMNIKGLDRISIYLAKTSFGTHHRNRVPFLKGCLVARKPKGNVGIRKAMRAFKLV